MSAESHAEHRRSPRFRLIVPLVLRGESPNSKNFQEETLTHSVSAHGALVVLATRVDLGQRLILLNPENWDEMQGRVARVCAVSDGSFEVRIEFALPAPEFLPTGAPPRKTHFD